MTAVVGVDISLTSTGMSDGTTTWTVRSAGKEDATLAERQHRLHNLVSKVLESGAGAAGLVVIEQPAYSRAMGHMHDRSGAWWLLVSELHQYEGVEVVEISPTALKKYATGRGGADKGAMADAAARRLPHIETNGQADRVDAAWLAVMGLDHLGGQPYVPQSHRDVLGKVAWPVGLVTA